MPLLELTDSKGYRQFGEAQCAAVGQSLADRYQSAAPFPHIVMEDFLDRSLLQQVVADFPGMDGKQFFERAQERFKYQFHPQECQGLATRNLFAELNSQAFLSFLGAMTGIEGLIADPYFSGAGLHATRRGGHLGIHADFNLHGTMKVERRLNLIIYLNEDWEEAYGGAIELWDREMRGCEVKVLPLMGRAVVFNTDKTSFHGHPDPLQCPDGRARRSIATYYYTASVDGQSVARNTDFRARPGTTDRPDWRVRLGHIADQWLPPVVRRRAHRIGL